MKRAETGIVGTAFLQHHMRLNDIDDVRSSNDVFDKSGRYHD
jgi:hypothetical protein